ncbi:hypothetical protein Pcinc_017343 [Petrolisthes cinctipes]|uniref:Nodal modulator 1 n=1 Tax=Petrolisthes cinctipes TaxID=88211 RepID=A0AAE1KNU9_PETCI|nr:hypothetical protein Pcinc_017343 [Petrolisthes cinctipes]
MEGKEGQREGDRKEGQRELRVIDGAGDILGCGGYVRSDVDINYSQVGIKLFTQQGNLKYETECAPNNGYYFMPIYDKGQYVIKVSPPPGWSFEPDEVSLKIDGETDACSLGKDINFHFKGFAVIGKVVSAGSDNGPEGVSVELYRGDTLVQARNTEEGGAYVFTPLSSGRYTVVASHPSWTFLADKVMVEVSDGNGDAGSGLVVAGYKLTGEVTTDGQPTPGVSFVLHAKHTLHSTPVCVAGKPEGYKSDEKERGDVVCHSVSGAGGSFVFAAVPPGKYLLVPYFHSTTTRYEVTPPTLEVTVIHRDLTLTNPFKIEGFSMRGGVRVSVGKEGMVGAKVVLDHTRTTFTDKDGGYLFDNVQSGKHRIKVTADKFEFEETVVSISPQKPTVDDITPVRYQVCFTVQVEKAAVHSGPWRVEVRGGGKKGVSGDGEAVSGSEGVSSSVWSVMTGDGGKGCIHLSPSQQQYTASVKLTPDADQAGLRFGPLEHTFTVSSEPIDELSFSQFLGEISGEIKCLEKCPPLTVSLRSSRGSGGSGGVALKTVTSSDSTFTIGDVVPGTYTLTVQEDEWCWRAKSMPVIVDTHNVRVTLEQIGYQLTLASSHQTTLSYTSTLGASGTVVAQKGSTLVCISDPGMYTLTPVGCHKFGSSQIQWSTSSPSLVTLSAVTHQLTGAVRATEVASFTVQVKSGEKVNTLGPLNPSPEDPHLYVFEVWVREGETVTLIPGSPSNLYQYQPPSHTLTMPADCVLGTVTFTAERALFIHGRVTPPIAGVKVSVEGNGQTYTYTTDAEGKYTAGPLDNSGQYTLSAEKKGYIMNKLGDKEGHFEAYKLAEIVVDVKDEEGVPLGGVLVSMSGGSSYRQNSLTEGDGTISFLSLTPGDYFLRPMMKEYVFDPASKMVTVDEGATIMISIKGVRVAYSVYGQAVSLSGEAESEVVVEVVGLGPECQHYQEEAVSDQQGHFRIRGLVPKCEYDLRLKTGSGINPHVQRALPTSRKIQPGEQDIRDLRLIVLRPFNQLDVAGKVDTDPQHLSSLVARLYRDDLPDSPLHTIKLGPHPFFMLPPMTADKRTYFLRLESSLPKSQYEYTIPAITFIADSAFKHLSLTFKPTLRSVDTEMSQGTVVGFVMSIILIAAAFNYDKTGRHMEKLQQVFKKFSLKGIQRASFSSDIPSMDAVRKRVKSRKT